MKRALCYFSGTGNTFYVASKIKERFPEFDLFFIPQTDPEAMVSYEEIGIITPCYMFGLPELVRQFVEKMCFSATARIFTVIVSGGFPALSLPILRQALNTASNQLFYAEFVTMPDSYILAYPVDEEKNKRLLSEADAKISGILEDLGAGKTTKFRLNTFGFLKPIQKFISKVAKNTAKSYVVAGCIGCKKCVNLCPVDNIAYHEQTVHFGDRCVGCLGCINICPVQAINYKKKTVGKKRYVNKSVDLFQMKHHK
jgi:ferredoxin